MLVWAENYMTVALRTGRILNALLVKVMDKGNLDYFKIELGQIMKRIYSVVSNGERCLDWKTQGRMRLFCPLFMPKSTNCLGHYSRMM